MLSKFFGAALILIGVDQITKAILSSRDFFVLGMHFHLVKNFGLSFGLDFGTAINLIVIVAAVILFIVYLPQDFGREINWGVVLVIAGAITNILDRIVLGYVRDFWDIGLGFTFNLADLYIFVGLVILLFAKSNSEQVGEMPQKNR